MNSYDIIKRPIITAKSLARTSEKTYSFEVARDANKIEIKRAIEEIFGVKVEKVNTVAVKGKLKRQGRNQGYTPNWKKATISLKKDSKAIEFFDSLT